MKYKFKANEDHALRPIDYYCTSMAIKVRPDQAEQHQKISHRPFRQAFCILLGV